MRTCDRSTHQLSLSAPPCGKIGGLLLIMAIFALQMIPGGKAISATIASVDQLDGYSNGVLEKVVGAWAPPDVAGPYQLRVQASLDDAGKVVECKVVKSSGNAALDSYACQLFRRQSPFGTPPYAMPIETYFAIWSDGNKTKKGVNNATAKAKTAQAAEKAPEDAKHQKYLAKAARLLRDKMYIPAQTKPGTYQAMARIKCDKAGKILSSSIVKSSGDKLLDKYILQGIKRAGSIPPPPAGLGDSLDLSFTLQRE